MVRSTNSYLYLRCLGFAKLHRHAEEKCYPHSDLRLHFSASNNTAEYEALINGLCIAIELGATRLDVLGDSELVIDQVMKESSCKSPLMAAYYQEVHKLEDKF